MSDAIGPDPAPDNGSGVIGEQAGAADELARQRLDALTAPVTEPEESDTLALEALKVAAYHNDEPAAVTSRADIYLDWLKNHGKN